jgi:hypothetical protein
MTDSTNGGYTQLIDPTYGVAMDEEGCVLTVLGFPVLG